MAGAEKGLKVNNFEYFGRESEQVLLVPHDALQMQTLTKLKLHVRDDDGR